MTDHIDDLTSALPPSLAVDERFALLEQLAARLNGLNLTPVLTNLVDLVGSDVLSWLGEQFSLFGDGWELATSDDDRRTLIKQSIEIHRHKGTPWAIKRMLALLGYADALLIEQGGYHYYDGEFEHDGSITYADLGAWFKYTVKMAAPILNEPAQRVRVMLNNIAPARCVLVGLDFSGTPYLYDATLSFDGAANFGVA